MCSTILAHASPMHILSNCNVFYRKRKRESQEQLEGEKEWEDGTTSRAIDNADIGTGEGDNMSIGQTADLIKVRKI